MNTTLRAAILFHLPHIMRNLVGLEFGRKVIYEDVLQHLVRVAALTAGRAVVESVVGTHRIILTLKERGYGEAGRWKRLMFDERGDCLWASRTMTCQHKNKGEA